MARRMLSRLRLLIVVAAVPLVLWGVLPLVSSGQPSPSQLQHKIDRKKAQIRDHSGRERVLTTDISASRTQIDSLQADITRLQTRQARIEVDLAPSAPSWRASRSACARSACGSRGCARAWPRRAPRSPSGSSSSTRPTTPTSSP